MTVCPKFGSFRFQQHYLSSYSTINTVDEDGRNPVFLRIFATLFGTSNKKRSLSRHGHRADWHSHGGTVECECGYIVGPKSTGG